MNRLPRFSCATALLCAASTSFAGTFSSDFNSGTNAPAGTTINGTTVIDTTGGVNNSGVLKLTKAINSQGGSFVISDLDSSAPVYGFDLTAKVRLGGGTANPADGFSINFDPTADTTSSPSEEGTTGGITFAFDLYDNGNETPPAPSIDLKVGGQLVATHKMSVPDFDTGTNFVNLHVRVAPDGGVSLAFKDNIIFTNIYFANYQPLTAANLVIGGRTGGANENQFFDDLSFTTYTQPQVGIAQQPQSFTALAGSDVALSVAANNAGTATYQWYSNNVAVAGATSPILAFPAILTNVNGAQYTVKVTGPNNTVTSQTATLNVKALDLPATPALSLNFNDGQTPANTLIAGTAAVAATGGVNDSGVLQITTDQGSESGAFVINDLSTGAPVYGFTAEFDLLERSANTPADGFSFNFAPDIPDDPTVSAPRAPVEGVGSGLTISFDTYDNGGGEAPAIDIIFNNKTIASKKVPIGFIMTTNDFAHVVIQAGNDGTVTVAYKGQIVHDHVFVPGFTSFSGGRFAFAGNTGGLSSDQFVDNIEITPNTTVGPLRLATAPTAQTVLVGKTATFNGAVNDTNGVTFQWFRNGTAIAGATSNSFTTSATTTNDNGALYKLQVSRGGTNVTSAEVALKVVNLTGPGAPQVSFDFENGSIPTGTHVYGSGTGIDGNPWTPIVSSGSLELTENNNSEAGAFVIDPLLNGAQISAINVSFDLRIGGGTTPPADGFSFDISPDLPANAATSGAEEGVGSGLSLDFDIYNNGNENPPAPSIDLKYKGTVIATTNLAFTDIETDDGTTPAFRTVLMSVAADGTINVAYGDRVLFSGIRATNYTFVSNPKFGFYARTGGLNANQWIDNVKIQATKSAGPLTITQDLPDIAVLAGGTVNFTVAVSDPTGATYQWSRNGTPISGATTASYTTPALSATDNGATYTVKVTGPSGTVTSRPAVVTVVPALTISNPKISMDFNDGSVPDNVTVFGTAGGGTFPGDGALHLTDASNGEGGIIVVPSLDAGAVSGFTLHAKVLVGGGSTPPADGFSVNWGTDIPTTTTFGEDGAGTGLVLSFDIYDNGNETPPAPSIDARWNGQLVGTVHLTYQQMETGTSFTDLFVHLDTDGTLDVQYNGMVIFNNLQIPGFTPLTGASFAIGARTGGLNENQWLDDLEIATSTGGSTAGAQMNISQAANGAITVSWTGGGVLQSTDALGPNANWTAVTGATSPYTAPNNTRMRFFRVAQ